MRRLLATLLLLLFLARAQASVAIRAGVEDLADASSAAVLGVVLDHTTALDAGTGTIWTRYRVRIERTLRGDAKGEVTVRIRGGKVGAMEQETLGSARLTDGGRVVLFLSAQDAGAREVIGMAQGAFAVETDAATGAVTCRNSIDGLSLVDRTGREAPAEPLRLTLADLEGRVKAVAERDEARRRAAREAIDRKLAAWRRQAEIHAEILRGKPGGPSQ